MKEVLPEYEIKRRNRILYSLDYTAYKGYRGENCKETECICPKCGERVVPRWCCQGTDVFGNRESYNFSHLLECPKCFKGEAACFWVEG